MSDPEKIPLQQAVEEGRIPCASCGAGGADTRELGGRKHFLCAACLRRSRFSRGLLALLSVTLAVVLVVLILKPKPASTPVPEGGDLVQALEGHLGKNQPLEALALLRPILEKSPRSALANYYAGRALIDLRWDEVAVEHLRIATAGGGAIPEGYVFWLAVALGHVDRAAEAVPLLEHRFRDAAFEQRRVALLAECYQELGRHEDVLKLFPTRRADTNGVYLRYRALRGLDRKAEAEQELEALDTGSPDGRVWRAYLQGLGKREEGDFAGAFQILQTMLSEMKPGDFFWSRLKRSEAILHLEAGDLEKALRAAQELAGEANARRVDAPLQVAAYLTSYLGEAIWAKVMAHLAAGARAQAVAAAKEFQEKIDPRTASLRQQRLMIRHLLGELKDADLEAEARATSKVRANDLYYYLALASGDKAWAKKALDSTPGRNFPYHAIRRLLEK